MWTPTWCISLIGSPPTTSERERATQVSCIQVIDHESRPRSFISLFQCPAFSLLFSSVTVQLFSCVCSSVQFFPCVFQCPVSIFFLRFSFACSNVQRFQFRIGDSGVSINSSPGSLHSSSPGDNNWFAWLLPWEQSGPHKASSSV